MRAGAPKPAVSCAGTARLCDMATGLRVKEVRGKVGTQDSSGLCSGPWISSH